MSVGINSQTRNVGELGGGIWNIISSKCKKLQNKTCCFSPYCAGVLLGSGGAASLHLSGGVRAYVGTGRGDFL